MSDADIVNLISQSPPGERRKASESPKTGIRKSPRLQQQQQAQASVPPETSKRNLFPEVDFTISDHKKLEEAIKKEPKGKAVLTNYATTKSLSNKEKGVIANIIAAVELKDSPTSEIKTSRLKELSKFVCRLFPTEDQEEWYSPHKTVNKISVRAKGRLQNIRDNIRKGLIAAGAVSSQRSRKAKHVVLGKHILSI